MDKSSILEMIQSWTEDDINHLPESESGTYEFKSSKTPLDKLKDKIQVAGSAFWNSGGGLLIAGVDTRGQVDGGIPEMIGRQTLRDWVDQALMMVEPPGPYAVQLVGRENGRSAIKDEHLVLVVAFGESAQSPHMAPDKKYYVRAGAHSGPAGHFLVEAIRSRRGLLTPLLRGLLSRGDGDRPNSLQLTVVALNEAVALDVMVSFDPVPKMFTERGLGRGKVDDRFPLRIPVIDRRNPFTMDVGLIIGGGILVDEAPICLVIEYQDLSGRIYHDRQTLDPKGSLGPLRIGSSIFEEMKKALDDVPKAIDKVTAGLSKMSR